MTTADTFDELKLAIDCVKHITTLATGIIVLTVTVLDKLKRPIHIPLILGFAVACMVICLFNCFMFLVGAGIMHYRADEYRVKYRSHLFAVYISFGIGIAFYSGFVIYNLVAG